MYEAVNEDFKSQGQEAGSSGGSSPASDTKPATQSKRAMFFNFVSGAVEGAVDLFQPKMGNDAPAQPNSRDRAPAQPNSSDRAPAKPNSRDRYDPIFL